MQRLLAALAVGFGVASVVGCAGNASYVYKNPDGSGGVIALKATGNQAEVRKLIEQHVGTGAEVEVNTIDPTYQQSPGAAKAEPGTMHYVYKVKRAAGGPGTGAPGGGIGQAGFNTPQPSMGGGMPVTGMGASGFGTGAGQPPPVFPGQR